MRKGNTACFEVRDLRPLASRRFSQLRALLRNKPDGKPVPPPMLTMSIFHCSRWHGFAAVHS